ncbi:MAG: metallophosphoesterase [Acidimicrobiales bacterium]
MPRRTRFRAFAVEDTSVQLAWAGLGAGRHTVAVGPVEGEVDGGAGTWTATGLAPGTTYAVQVDRRPAGSATTLDALAGPERCRIATVSDCHVGENGFGFLLEMEEPAGVEPYAIRCLRAATEAAVAWGAQLLVVKGDLTQRAQPAELDAALEVLSGLGIPVAMTPGNHEVKRRGSDWAEAARAAGLTTAGSTDPHVIDLPGLRVVVGDSTIPHHHDGTLAGGRAEALVEAAAGGGRPALVCIHHQLEPRSYHDVWPPGIPGSEAVPFLDRLAEVAPHSWVTTGHTHRNRGRRHGPVTVTEVGSTKDFPGVWAGYVVHDGGMRQTSFHVTGDGTDAWLDRTRKAAARIWGFWSPGDLGDRCRTVTWD